MTCSKTAVSSLYLKSGRNRTGRLMILPTLVGDGKIIGYQLEELDKDKNWLEDALAGIDKQIGDIYFTEWNAEKGRHIQDYNGTLYDYDELNFHENPEKSGSFLCW